MKSFLLLLLLVVPFIAEGQYDGDGEYSTVNLGFGIGITYGGFGARLSALPAKQVALFGAAGYNLNGLGYNLGAQFRLMPDSRVIPSLMAMYGYNAVIVVRGAEYYNQTYYGPTVGTSVEFHNRNGQNFFNVELLIPFRSQEYRDDLDTVKNDPIIGKMTEPLPIAISLGYHMKF